MKSIPLRLILSCLLCLPACGRNPMGVSKVNGHDAGAGGAGGGNSSGSGGASSSSSAGAMGNPGGTGGATLANPGGSGGTQAGASGTRPSDVVHFEVNINPQRSLDLL